MSITAEINTAAVEIYLQQYRRINNEAFNAILSCYPFARPVPPLSLPHPRLLPSVVAPLGMVWFVLTHVTNFHLSPWYFKQKKDISGRRR